MCSLYVRHTPFLASSMAVGLFQFSHLYNTEHGIMSHPSDNTVFMPISHMPAFRDCNAKSKDFQKVAERIQNLDLTNEETILASALCIMIAGENSWT